MSELERKRRQRQLGQPLAARLRTLRRAFDVAGADAQAAFIRWLKKANLMD